MKNLFLAAALAALAAACVRTPDAPPVLASPLCGTPSECPFLSWECENSKQKVWLDYEPAPWGPELIECCPLFPGKCPAQAAPICAVLDTISQPWQLRIWSDSVTLFQDIEPPYFCMDEYTGHWYAYFSGDTLKVDLRDYDQVRKYLNTQWQIQFVIEVHCND